MVWRNGKGQAMYSGRPRKLKNEKIICKNIFFNVKFEMVFFITGDVILMGWRNR